MVSIDRKWENSRIFASQASNSLVVRLLRIIVTKLDTGIIKMFFVTPDEIRRLLNGLTPQQKEVILAEQIAELPAESKARILGFSDSSLTLVTGSFVPLNSEVAVNIKNTSAGFEPETVF